MKLFSDLTLDESLDIICDVTVPILNILDDDNLISLLQEKTEVKTIADVKRVGAKKFANVLQILLKNKRNETVAILAPFFEMSEAELLKQNALITLANSMKLWQDKEFQNFLLQLQEQEKQN